jgi:hypothetical protein
MKLFKNWIFWGLVLSVVGVIGGFALLYPAKFGICTADFTNLIFDTSCLKDSSDNGMKLFYPSVALTFIFFVLLFTPTAVRAWRKFSAWYILLAILWLASYSESFSAWDFSEGIQGRAMSVSSMYIGISVGIIAVALISQWQQKKKGAPALRWWWYWIGAVVSLLLFSGVYRGIMDTTLSVLNALF